MLLTPYELFMYIVATCFAIGVGIVAMLIPIAIVKAIGGAYHKEALRQQGIDPRISEE